MNKKELKKNDFLLYTSSMGDIKVEVFLQNETVWLTQSQIAFLFSVERSVITKHLRNIFKSKELDKKSVCAKIAHTATDGKIYKTQFYNLDAIIAVGYRVNSKQATHFRIWATKILREFIIKGFVLDDYRLKQGKKLFEQDYFKELLGNSYLSFNPNNVDDIIDKIKSFIEKKPNFDYKNIIKQYSFEKMTDETVRIYQEVLYGN